jgi:hypothetical protein
MARPRNFLNVKTHLEHLQLILDGYFKYGQCPVIDREFRKLSMVNKAILRNAAEKSAAGNRHDLYVGKK